ncbi:MAG: cytochrome c [candidate division Zixibacteria bacterium]|nr:cytochrome c [candidate division Zixibacteria bacterium]
MNASTLTAIFGISAVVVAVGILIVGGSGQSSSEPVTPVEHGKRLFRIQGCSSCHAIGGGMSRGPDLAGVINRLRVQLDTTAYQMQTEKIRKSDPEVYNTYAADYATILSAQGDERIRYWLIKHLENPRFDHPDGLMPTFRHLTPEQTDQLIAFLFTLQ